MSVSSFTLTTLSTMLLFCAIYGLPEKINTIGFYSLIFKQFVGYVSLMQIVGSFDFALDDLKFSFPFRAKFSTMCLPKSLPGQKCFKKDLNE